MSGTPKDRPEGRPLTYIVTQLRDLSEEGTPSQGRVRFVHQRQLVGVCKQRCRSRHQVIQRICVCGYRPITNAAWPDEPTSPCLSRRYASNVFPRTPCHFREIVGRRNISGTHDVRAEPTGGIPD